MKILVIGDSHCLAGWPDLNIPGVEIETLYKGPKLMHTIGKGKEKLFSVNGFPPDMVIFCFGEIDVRNQLHRWRKDIANTIRVLVTEYLATIKLNMKEHSGVKTGVYFVPPPAQKDVIGQVSNYPFRGEDSDRLEYTRLINGQLKKGCQDHGFIFIDLYSAYCDERGFLRPEMSDGSVHIGTPRPLRDFVLSKLKED